MCTYRRYKLHALEVQRVLVDAPVELSEISVMEARIVDYIK